MKGYGWIIDLVFVVVIIYLAFLFLPRFIAQISASNAALNSQYSPQGAWNRVQASWINSAGNVGTDLIGVAGEDLLGVVGG